MGSREAPAQGHWALLPQGAQARVWWPLQGTASQLWPCCVPMSGAQGGGTARAAPAPGTPSCHAGAVQMLSSGVRRARGQGFHCFLHQLSSVPLATRAASCLGHGGLFGDPCWGRSRAPRSAGAPLAALFVLAASPPARLSGDVTTVRPGASPHVPVTRAAGGLVALPLCVPKSGAELDSWRAQPTWEEMHK